MSRITLLTLVGVLFLMPVVAQATLMENQTTPAVIFQDGFEGVASGAAPVAAIGTWSAPNLTGSNALFVTDSTTEGIAAYAGDQFLKFDMLSYSGNCEIAGTVDVASGVGDTVQARFAIRNEVGTGIRFISLDDTGAAIGYVSFVGPTSTYSLPANAVTTLSGGGRVQTGLYTTPGAWNEVVITYTNGDMTSWSVSVNGSTYAYTGYDSFSAGNWSGLKVFAWGGVNMASVSYVDAVPEPSTLALLGTGLIGLLCYAWRKRK